jgi:hypothetical protein
MRFMMMIKSDERTETGAMPSNKIVEAMNKYNQELADAGALLAAEGLYPSSKGAIVKFHAGKPAVTDGPFAEAKELIAGYWLIQAKSLQEAIEWARRVPFEAGEDAGSGEGTGEVEVRQIFELEDFPVNENESGWREAEAAYRAETASGPAVRPGLQQFMILRMADKDTESGAPLPSEELLAAMGAYNEEMIRAGVMLSGDGLQPSSKGARVTYSRGKRTVVDGPFTEAKELIAGFSVIQVKSKAEAIDWAKRWPAQDANGEAELRIRQVFLADDFSAQLPPDLREADERVRSQVSGKR